ncbi:MAG TPA: HAD family phosphatase [Candidatus Pullilachnospira intestinigallinarum]|nr:HAD family phosphatase [Candidatus Pullilachnospira intestinigallinarum]
MMKGAIFDVDGVLLDSMEEWDRLGETYLTCLGIRAGEGLADTLATMSMEEGAAWLIRHYGISRTVEQAVEEMAAVMRDAYACRIPKKKGVENYLRGLSGAGIPMVIATSGDGDNARTALERLGLWNYFRGMLTCTQVGAGKNRPDIFLAAAKILEGVPEEIWVFEDAPHAAATARAAGFHVAAVKDAQNARQEAQLARTADIYLKDYGDFEMFRKKAGI